MKKAIAVFLIAGLIFGGAGTGKLYANANTDRAVALVNHMQRGNFQAVVDAMDDTMKGTLTAENLKEIWQAVQQQLGPFRGIGSTREDKLLGNDVVFVTCFFERSSLDVQIAFNDAGKVSGLYLVPTGSVEPTRPSDTTERNGTEVLSEENRRSMNMMIGSGEWQVPGILEIPGGRGPFPAVVLVHGSGPQDRDSTIGPNKPFRDLSDGLVKQGIAVLRYDKRTFTHSAKVAQNIKGFTVRDETIDDALAAVKLLQDLSAIDKKRIFVLGHSLGGMLAPRIASLDDSIAGIILMAANTRRIEDLLLDQLEYLASLEEGEKAEQLKQNRSSIEKIVQRIKNEDADEATNPAEYLLGVPDSYYRHLGRYSPTEMAKQVNRPILILQGARDYQVTTKDFEGWKSTFANRQNVEFRQYPNLNHLFMSGQGKSSPSEYHTPGTVDDAVIKDIADWIKRQK